MARTKVKLQFISNNTVRRSTLKKRQQNLLKKVHEISILCGVDACCIIYNPEDVDNPQVWPQPEDVTQILITFYNLPENERNRKMTSHLAFVQERVATLKKKVVKRDNDNDKLEVLAILYESFEGNNFVGLTGHYLRSVAEALDELIAKVYTRISTMRPPPEARDEEILGTGTGTDMAVEPVVGTKTGVALEPVVGTGKCVAMEPAFAIPTTIASAEVGSSNQAKGGTEFYVKGSSNIGSSDCESELGDNEDDDDDDEE